MVLRYLLPLCLITLFPADAQTTQWTLTWSDEFNGSSLDTNKWVYDTGGNGWGNNELEYYTNRSENLTVADGMLVIHARKETYKGPDNVERPYTSARIKTLGKFSQTYGRFEARIRIPYGQGIWPAFWMLGDDVNSAGWPKCGELDIMENIGKEPATAHGTLHGPGYSGASGIGGSYSLSGGARFADDFHLYAIEWDAHSVHWFVDDYEYFHVDSTTIPPGTKWVFDHPFHILLNVAVGGSWPGNPDQTSSFPQIMQVDYVRVYQAGAKPTVRGAANGASFQPEMAPGSWFTVAGSALAQTTREWRADDIVDGNLPTDIAGTQLLVNGKPAYIAYVSPNQINALVPDTATGPASLTVVAGGVASDPLPASLQTYAPAFFYWSNNRPVATSLDYQPMTQVRPGDALILWGTGFGPTVPPVPPGVVSPVGAVLADTPAVTLDSQPVEYLGGALAPGSAGLYQIAIRVPDSTPAGELRLNASIGGVSMNPASVYLLSVAR